MSTDNQKLISFIEGRLRGDALCMPAQTVERYRTQVFEAALGALKAAEGGLSAADYEEVLADQRRLVRELDVLINGESAAQQASLCDIVAQVRSEGLKALPEGWTRNADADAALVMLDRIDTTDTDDDCRIEEVKNIIRRLAYAPAPVAFIDGDVSPETMQQLLEELKTADRGRIMVTPPSPAAPDDLIMQVRRLVHALKNANPDHSLVKQVPDYMRRMGYWSAGDCLRGEQPIPGGENG